MFNLSLARVIRYVVSDNTGAASPMTLVDEIRAFNRFYTREIGLLDKYLPASDLSLPEARVLYELANADGQDRTAADIGGTLRMDKAHLSRIVARFRRCGLLRSRAEHGRHVLLSLTEAGRRTFLSLDAGTRAQMEALLLPLDQDRRQRLAAACARSVRSWRPIRLMTTASA